MPVDGYLQMGDEEAIAVARRLAREEGVFAGFSSGADVAAALRLLQGPHAGETVAVVLADSGLKYLSTDLWPAFGGDAAKPTRARTPRAPGGSGARARDADPGPVAARFGGRVSSSSPGPVNAT